MSQNVQVQSSNNVLIFRQFISFLQHATENMAIFRHLTRILDLTCLQPCTVSKDFTVPLMWLPSINLQLHTTISARVKRLTNRENANWAYLYHIKSDRRVNSNSGLKEYNGTIAVAVTTRKHKSTERYFNKFQRRFKICLLKIALKVIHLFM